MVGLGVTRNRRPFVVYGAFGPEDSNEPIAVGHKRMVGVESLDETGNSPFIPYKPIRVHNVRPFAVVGNFQQTGTIFKQVKAGKRAPYGVLQSVLYHSANQVNGHNTSPRIAGSVAISGRHYTFTLGFSHPDGPTALYRNYVQPGNALMLEAYSGNANLRSRARDVLIQTSLKGNIPDQIIDSLSGMSVFPPIIIAAAVWLQEDVRWDLAVRDLYS